MKGLPQSYILNGSDTLLYGDYIINYSVYSMMSDRVALVTGSLVFTTNGKEWGVRAMPCLLLLPEFPYQGRVVWRCGSLCIKDSLRQPLASFTLTPKQE